MTEFRHLKPFSATGVLKLADVGAIADNLRRGSMAVLPTETGYMLAALATSVPAIQQVFTAKGRNTANVMHVACGSLSMARTAVSSTRPRSGCSANSPPGRSPSS